MRMLPSELPDVVNDNTEEILATTSRTHNGQRLSPKEDIFIQLYLRDADPMTAARDAGYSIKDTYKNKELQWRKKGLWLLEKDYIKDEIAYRLDQLKSAQIADAQEVMMYLTRVMRGDEKDQFGLDTSIADRTAAAKELNRRFHELETSANVESKKEVHLVLERR